MASISSQLTLYDGASPVLARIESNMQSLLNSFSALQQSVDNAMNTRGLQAASGELIQQNSIAEQLTEQYHAAASAASEIPPSVQDGNDAMDGMLRKAKNLIATLGLAKAAQKAVAVSDTLASNTARLSLIVDDQGSIPALEDKIYTSAMRSRAAYTDVSATISKLGLTAGEAFTDMNGKLNTDEILRFTELLNKNFIVGGASATEQAAATYQLTQAMASGRLQGDEYRSIIENAPLLANAVEDYMHNVQGATGSMKEWASEGMLTADVIKAALFSSADEVEQRFRKIPLTWGQVWTMASNVAIKFFNPLLKAINWVANNLSVIGPLVLGVGAAFLVFQVAAHWTQIAAVAAGIYNGVVNFLSIGFGVLRGSTEAASRAQMTYNSALLASPITWVVILVLALVAALIAVCNWIAKSTGIAQSGFGIIAGGINVAVQAVKNAGLWIAEIAMGIWGAIKAVCSNIGTAFHNVISNVQGWFYGLLATALTVVEGICAALNKLPFVEFDYSGISAKADEYAAKSAAAYGNKEEYTNVADAFGAGKGDLGAFSSGWASDAYKSGAAWGDGVADKMGGMFGGGDGSGFTLDSIAADTGSIADSAGSMAESLEVSNEELKYLRDIAEREVINRFTTAEIKIDMTGMTNRIDGSVDLDGVLTTLTDKYAEALVTASEGVHS